MKRFLLSLCLLITVLSANAQCWQQVAAGLDHTLAIKPDGTLWGWGGNFVGQLGLGVISESVNTPVQIGTDNDWKEISAGGFNSMAVKNDGTLWAWGSNQFGQIGDGLFGLENNVISPKKIGTATNWKTVSAGSSYSMAIRTDGTLWGWGGNLFGQLGTSGGNPFLPTQVGTSTDWKMVSASVVHTFAIKTDGTLWGWGSNMNYQLGNESIGSSSVPVRLGPAVTWQSISTGYNFTMGITTDGKRWNAGFNDYGQLGNGSFLESYDFMNIDPSVTWKAIAVGYNHVTGIKSDGTLWTWGFKIGTFDDKSNIPVQVGTDNNWESLSAGDYHTFAFKTDGSLWGWGQGEYGKLGNDSWVDITQPQNIGGGTPTGESIQSFCGSATIADLHVTSGTNVQWYTQATGGSPLATNTALVNGGHYYASQTIAGCESLVRFHVMASVNTIPSAPSGFDAQNFCSGTALSAVEVEGTNIKWYATASGGSALTPGTVLVNNAHYFASQTVNGCESATRFEVTITLNTTAAPTGTTSQTVCFNATLASLTATGTNIKWYSTPAGGSPLSAGTILVDQQYYYASQTVSSFESCTRLAVKANVTPNTPPTGGTYYEFCFPATVASLYIETGTNIKWYTTASGGSPLTSATLLVNGGHYYASQTIGSCETTARLEAYVVVNLTPKPLGDEVQHRCPGTTLANLSVTGPNIKWYATLFDTTPIPASTPLAEGGVYYATATIDTLESCDRLEIWVVLDGNAAPTGYETKAFCGSATIADLEVYGDDGAEFKWYLASSGGSALPATHALQNNTSYYATQTVNGCESPTRHEVFVEVNTTPTPAPSGSATQTFCSPATVQQLEASGTLIEWYNQPVGGAYLVPGTPLVDGTHYYAQQTITACVSASRLDVLVTVRQTPPAPNVPTTATWTAITTNYLSVLGIKSDGTLRAWGSNQNGEGGVGTNTTSLPPALVGTQGNWKRVESGWKHTIAIREDGTLWAWGNNEYGQLGDGTTISKNSPVQIGTANDWNLIAAGWGHSVAIKTDGTLWAWGFNELGQVGDGTTVDRLTPVKIGNETTWKSLSISEHTSYAIKTNGTLWGWGYSGNVLGDGDAFGLDKHAPVQIGAATDWKEISVNLMNRFAIKNNGTLWAWGDRIVRDPTQDNVFFGVFVPTQFKTDSDWKTISTGPEHALGIKNNGTLWALWGRSGYGELAHPNFIVLVHIDNPFQIGSDTDWNSVETGANLSFAIKNNGSLWGWGRNDLGQLPGDQFPYLHSNVPMKIESFESEEVCVGSTVADLNAIGTNVQWFSAPSGGSALSPSASITIGSRYYAEQTVNGCKSSSRLDVIALDGVAPPAGLPQQSFCPGTTVASLNATGTNVKWFSASSGGTQLSATTLLTHGTSYFAEQTQGACTSSRLSVTVSLTTPAAPSGTATQTFCPGASVASLTAIGTDVKWFSASSGGSALAPATPLTNGTHYFATQTINGCESSSRFDVTVSITTTAAPSGSTAQAFCPGATVANLTATGTAVTWYSASSGGSPLASSAVLVNGNHYYASQTLNGCESIPRLDVTATINTTALPLAGLTQTFCLTGTVASLNASGTALKWYSAATGGSPLAATVSLTNNAHYFVSQTLNGCESARLEITAVITHVDAPTGDAEQSVLEDATVADLEAIGTDITWYTSVSNAAAGINKLLSIDLLMPGLTYYATQTISGCESDEVLSVTVSLITGLELNDYELKVYPNPVKDRFRISAAKKIDNLVAINNLGQAVFMQSINATEAEVDFSNMASGVYSIQLQLNDRVIVVKVLKQ